jgi:hypothetical protein
MRASDEPRVVDVICSQGYRKVPESLLRMRGTRRPKRTSRVGKWNVSDGGRIPIRPARYSVRAAYCSSIRRRIEEDWLPWALDVSRPDQP